MMKYTLVQHSGAGYAGKPAFEKAVEEIGVRTKTQMERVRESGGVLFDSYAEAANRAMAENYPPEVVGLYPKVRGSFSSRKVGGLRIYIPAKEDNSNG